MGVLAVAIVAFVAVGLVFPASWPGQVLQGAGVAEAGGPTVFPSDEIVPDTTLPRSAAAENGGVNMLVTLRGLWNGYCKVWGADAGHPAGVKYTAGTLKMLVGEATLPGYCIDLHHDIELGDTYQANVHPGTAAELCQAHWILANYSRERPGGGLKMVEEGVAIQAALWYYVEGFQPVWDAQYWCGKQAVYQRAMDIINAAQCAAVPASIELTASSTTLKSGETANLTATVRDQAGNPFPGQTVTFASTTGSMLAAPSGVTDAEGKVANTFRCDGIGTHTVTASMSGAAGSLVVDPVSEPKQRIVVVKSDAAVNVTWEAAPAAVIVENFTAQRQKAASGAGQVGAVGVSTIILRWQTTSEVDNLGFNVYRASAKKGPWTQINPQLIPSLIPPGSSTGASYEWTDTQAPPAKNRVFYLLEAVGVNGKSQFGPITP